MLLEEKSQAPNPYKHLTKMRFCSKIKEYFDINIELTESKNEKERYDNYDRTG